jgi:diguanylate cyclase (GGDEF)-like protein
MRPLLTSAVVVVVTAVGFVVAILWRRWVDAAEEFRDEVRRLDAARSEELTMMTRLADGLAGMRDFDQLRRWLAAEVAPLMGTEPYWILAWANGRALLLAGTPTEPGGAIPADLTSKPQSWECFPLIASGQPVGLLAACRPIDGLSEDARRTLGLLASLIASAVRNIQLLTRARALSMIDPLTGCLTRQFGLEALSREMSRMRRGQAVVCVAMLDLDGFKRLNDTHGHAAGDRALAMVGRVLKEGLRASDIACRYGGDEFLIVLPDTTPSGATRAIDNLRRRISNISAESGVASFEFSASAGITSVESGEEDTAAIVARADAAMYRNKRNQAAAVQAPPIPVPSLGVPSAFT